MRNAAFGLVSVILFIASLFVVVFPEWFKMTDYDSLFGSKLMIRKGLWLKCVRVSPGVNNCDAYMDPIQSLPGWVIGSRFVTSRTFIKSN